MIQKRAQNQHSTSRMICSKKKIKRLFPIDKLKSILRTVRCLNLGSSRLVFFKTQQFDIVPNYLHLLEILRLVLLDENGQLGVVDWTCYNTHGAFYCSGFPLFIGESRIQFSDSWLQLCMTPVYSFTNFCFTKILGTPVYPFLTWDNILMTAIISFLCVCFSIVCMTLCSFIQERRLGRPFTNSL